MYFGVSLKKVISVRYQYKKKVHEERYTGNQFSLAVPPGYLQLHLAEQTIKESKITTIWSSTAPHLNPEY